MDVHFPTDDPTPTRSPLVDAQREGPRLTIMLRRPPRHTLDLEMLNELLQITGSVLYDDTLKVITLTASGEYFSAGFNPHALREEDLFAVVDAFHRLIQQIIQLPTMVVGLINGHALGAGCVLAAVCDFALAPETARFGHPEVKFGHFTPMAVFLYPRLMARNRALYLSLSGELVDAKTAAGWGLISWALPPDQWATRAERFVQRLVDMPQPLLQNGRRAFWRAMIPQWDDWFGPVEESYLVHHAPTQAARDGLQRWIESDEEA